MTAISTLTNKNQTTVPKVVVEALDIKPSDKLIYEIEGDHVVLRAQTGRLADLLNEASAGPQPKQLFPYEWYESPNIHFLTVHDFENLARAEGLLVERRYFLAGHRNETYFVSDIVLVETVWTLRAAFRWEPAPIATALRRLAAKPDVEFTDRHGFTAAVKALETGGDFADELIISSAREEVCSALATFDGSLQKHHPEFTVALK